MSGVKLKLAAIFLHKSVHDVKCHVKQSFVSRKRFVIIEKASNSIYVHKLKSLERNIEEEDHPWRALPHLKSDCRGDVAFVGELRPLSADALLKTLEFADDRNTPCTWKVSYWTKVTKLRKKLGRAICPSRRMWFFLLCRSLEKRCASKRTHMGGESVRRLFGR